MGVVILLAGTIAAGPKLPKGDLSPPVRVRWAEPDDPLPEEPEPPEPIEQKVTKEVPAPVEVPQHVIVNGYGSMGRVSHLAEKTFGRNDSITPIEGMPYLLTDEHFIFADARGFVTNRSEAGGNFGLGYRRLMDDWNAWGGASVWYDADQSTGKMFQQIGLSFEGLINQVELRSNVYLPITSSQNYSNSISNSSFVGNQLLYTRTTDIGSALRGVDAEAGYSLPVMDRHVVRGFVGGYHFEGGSYGGVTGFKARVEAVINNTITAQALYTNDKLYGSNVMVGLSMQFPFGNNHPTTGWNRSSPSPFRFVERLYNVVVARSQTDMANQVATDPQTGKAYVVDQVYAPNVITPFVTNSATGTPDGSSANPFSTIQAAQAAGGNVIFVQSGSVIQTPVTLTAGQHLFGQGNFAESLATTGGGRVPIPNLVQAAQQSGSTPLFQSVAGTTVTLASNTEIAGFHFLGGIDNGISGNGVSNVSIHDLTLSSIGSSAILGSPGSDAIQLTNTSGNISLSRIQVDSATGNGIVINGGNPNVLFSGGGSTISAQGNGFVVENLTGGTIIANNLVISNVGGKGLLLNNVAADTEFNGLSVSQSGTNGAGDAAVVISGKTGMAKTVNGVATTVYNTDTFSGSTRIISPTGPGFSVTGSDARINIADLNVSTSSTNAAVSLADTTNPIGIGNLTINTQNALGLSANNVASLQVNGGSITTVNAPAMDVESSKFNATLGSVSVNGGPYGIKIQGSTGNFTITGNGGNATGGTIQNTTTAGVIVNSYGNTSLSWIDFINNQTAIQSTNTNALMMSGLRISGSSGYAIDSMNDLTFSLGSSTLSGNGALVGGTIREQATTLGTYSSTLTTTTITDNNPNGAAFQLLTQSGAAGSTLTTQITSNVLNGYGSGSSLVGVNWTGPMTSNVANNTINAYGTNITAVSLADPSATAVFAATFTNNAIYFESGANLGTGISVVDGQSGQFSTGNSALTMTSNSVDFQGTGGTGFRFGLYEASSNTITYNTVTDHVGGVTGMIYDYVASSSNLIINANKISFFAGDTLPHRSFVFAQGAPTVTLDYLQGSPTNWVYNTPTPSSGFSMKSGIGTGGLLINNNYVAAP